MLFSQHERFTDEEDRAIADMRRLFCHIKCINAAVCVSKGCTDENRVRTLFDPVDGSYGLTRADLDDLE